MSFMRHFSQRLTRHPIFSGSYLNRLRDTTSIVKRRNCQATRYAKGYKIHIMSMNRNSSTGVLYARNYQATLYAEGYKTAPKIKRETYDISYIDDEYIHIRWNTGSIDKFSVNDSLPENGKYPEN